MIQDGLWTSESVTEGHPDKLCDQISDAILDACLEQDPQSHVACETAVGQGIIFIAGEVKASANVDYEAVARGVVRDVGYTEETGLDPDRCDVVVRLHDQSQEIDSGVSRSEEVRTGVGLADPRELQGAGDQGMMFGFACDETGERMPKPIHLAHELTRRLAEVRKTGEIPWLRPDGKSQVTVRYADGKPQEVVNVVLAAQHDPGVGRQTMSEELLHGVVRHIIPKHAFERCHINSSGSFVLGGPAADAGLTGRKIIVDTYGGMARHGGGAFSGKDPSKVDRSAAYAARWVAKHLVHAKLAKRVEIQLSYVIGRAHPTSLFVDSFGTGVVDDASLQQIVAENFDLRPAAIVAELQLTRTRYRPTASYGHFGPNEHREGGWNRMWEVVHPWRLSQISAQADEMNTKGRSISGI